MKKIVIITRHAGAVEWLKSKGYSGEVVPHFNGEVEAGTTYIRTRSGPPRISSGGTKNPMGFIRNIICLPIKSQPF